MEFQLQNPKSVVIRQPEVVEVSSVVVERILDDVLAKKIIVWLKDFPHPVELADLSGESYDNPPWTNELILTSIQAFVNSL